MFSFRKRNQQLDVHKLIRRLIDSSSPNMPPVRGNVRWEDRSNRTLPVVLLPIANGRPQLAEAATAITKNLSSQGLALVLHQPFWAEGVLIGFLDNGVPEFVRGEIRQNAAIGGGFWQLGIELTERVSSSDVPEIEHLRDLVERLDPRRDQAEGYQLSRSDWRP